MSTYDFFVTKIDDYVNFKLDNYIPSVKYGKVIHDPVWGSVFYYKWEIQIIDSPLFQRLRDINQVGLAMQIYPAAHHSRFEHSLGTVAIASRIFEKILENKNRKTTDTEKIPYLDNEGLCLIRLAALMHDIGHCFYSHLSECIYGEMDEFRKLIEEFKNKFGGLKPKPHEIFSYLIVNSMSFKKFFNEFIDYPYKTDNLFEMVSNTIIGMANQKTIEKQTEIYSYLTSLINGDFDADKLDYIMRDSYTAGLALTYDIERFLYKINIFSNIYKKHNKTEYLLVIEFSGITSVEELTFSKLMLYSYIYHHQKILVTEAVLKDVIFGMINLGILKHPCDFLYFTDNDITSLKYDKRKPFPDSEKTLGALISQVIKRNLPKKCFVLNRKMVEIDQSDIIRQKTDVVNKCYKVFKKELSNEDVFSFFENFAMQFTRLDDGNQSIGIRSLESTLNKIRKQTYEEYFKLRKSFYEKLVLKYKEEGMDIKFDFLDIHIIIPSNANFTSSNSSVVLFLDNRLEKLDSVMNLNDWGDSFNANKWNGYVFISNNINPKIAHSIAKGILIESPTIKLNNSESYVKYLID